VRWTIYGRRCCAQVFDFNVYGVNFKGHNTVKETHKRSLL
jgi:hypothetical protein